MVTATDVLNAKILVVDDQEANVLLLKRALDGAGYVSVASTMNPHEVCELHRINRYDLIILDLQMPGMDGIEAVCEIRKFSNVPIVFVSGNSDPKTFERAKETEIKAFLTKPVSLEMLKEILD